MKLHISAATTNRCISFARAARYLSEQAAFFFEIVPDPAQADLHIYVGVPLREQIEAARRIPGKPFVWFTMCEQTVIPPEWVSHLSNDPAVIVPCTFCDYVFRACGVQADIHTVRLGVDPAEYRYIDRPNRDTYTYYWQGTSLLFDRKCGWMVEQAFRDLDLPGSRLLLKTVPHPGPPFDFRVGNIRQIASWASVDELNALDYEADCFVWPTRAEGFGMVPLEKMATGLPVICTDWSGPHDYLRDGVSLPLRDFQFQESIYGPQCGHDAAVNIESLKAHMRWCYDHRDEARAIGRRAAKYVAEEWTWEKRTRPELKAAIEQIGGMF